MATKKNQKPEDVAEEEQEKTRKFQFRPTAIPFTCNLKHPIPDYSGHSIDYSSYLVGFTQIPIEVETVIEVEVPDTGNELNDFTTALRKLGLAIFQATVELSREAWQLQKDRAKEELLDQPL